uniref:uncharacterized protein LOC120336616 n=1 Tax=Styela clava TaxID=7725 RepID=UPI00193A9500|nr:uncharacterized protein LOC120336616 [Styela clava]
MTNVNLCTYRIRIGMFRGGMRSKANASSSFILQLLPHSSRMALAIRIVFFALLAMHGIEKNPGPRSPERKAEDNNLTPRDQAEMDLLHQEPIEPFISEGRTIGVPAEQTRETIDEALIDLQSQKSIESSTSEEEATGPPLKLLKRTKKEDLSESMDLPHQEPTKQLTSGGRTIGVPDPQTGGTIGRFSNFFANQMDLLGQEPYRWKTFGDSIQINKERGEMTESNLTSNAQVTGITGTTIKSEFCFLSIMEETWEYKKTLVTI